MNKPDVSVVVANYNHSELLPEFFCGIMASDELPKELIIVDDASTDSSLEVIGQYLKYPFIKLIELKENVGFANALNTGIRHATGKYIARIDPDDLIMPDRIARQFAFLESHPEIDVLGGNVIYFHHQSRKDILTSNFLPDHSSIYSAYCSGDHGVQHPTVMAKASVYKQYPYDQRTFPAEDYHVFARMIKDGHRFANLTEPVNRMRIHEDSVSNNICFATIDRTFSIRDEVFNRRTSQFHRRRIFLHILYYRRFLFSEGWLKRMLFLGLSSLLHPWKVLLRVRSLLS